MARTRETVRGRLIFAFFFGLWWSGCLLGFLSKRVRNVVHLRGKRGGVVVVCVAKRGGKLGRKMGQALRFIFAHPFGGLGAPGEMRGSFAALRMTTRRV